MPEQNKPFRFKFSTNIWSNISAATVSAAVTAGLGLFLFGGGLTSAVITTGNGAAALCANFQAVCNNVEPVMKGIDFLEETGLMIKGAVQTCPQGHGKKGRVQQGSVHTGGEGILPYKD